MIALQALAVLAMLHPAGLPSSPLEVTFTCPANVVQGEPLLVECHIRNVSDQPVWIDLALPLVTLGGAEVTPVATLPTAPTGAVDELRPGHHMTQMGPRREEAFVVVALVLQKTQSLLPGPNSIALHFRIAYTPGDKRPYTKYLIEKPTFAAVARHSEIHTVEVEPATPDALLAAAYRLSRKATHHKTRDRADVMKGLLAMPVDAEPAWREALVHQYFTGAEAMYMGFAAKRQDAAGRRTMEFLLELAQQRKSELVPHIRKMLADDKGN